jgi:uncharacterized protein (DUF58 family)
MPDQEQAYLDYRVRWRSGESRPGRHKARQAGAGGDFRAYRPFWQVPDASRIDVRRSILQAATDPGGGIMVRQMEQRSAIDLVLAVDVSRSMTGMSGLASLARAAGRSALRAGDGFGLLAFDAAMRDSLCLPPTRTRGAVRLAAEGLERFVPIGRGAGGILDLAAHLPARRCLVILASDFLMDLDLLGRALAALWRHDVAPVVLHPPSVDAMPHWGLLRVRDAESSATRLLLMRPALRRRWRAAEVARRRALDALFATHCREALHVTGGIDIGRLSEHLMGG